MKNKSLDFVARYYRHGALDIKSAYRKTLTKAYGSHKVQSSKLKAPSPKLQAQWLAAAAIAVLLICGGVLLFRPSVTMLAAADTNKTFTLQDGTVVTLAPHSTLSYKGDCREVELTGKAYLNIHHDPEHPFMIKDKSYVIKDIGTRLMVDESRLAGSGSCGRPQEAKIMVYVEEGSVSLSPAGDTASGITLSKAQGATITANGKLRRMAQASQNMTVWATHEFHFADTPLQEVLRDLSDYYGVRLVLDDSGVSQSSNLKAQTSMSKRLTADFHADSLRTIVGMIEETLDVEIKTE